MPSIRVRKANGIHAERLKAIRPYVEFDYNLNRKLTPSQKAQITRYHKEIFGNLLAQPRAVKRFRSKERLEATQIAAGNRTEGLPQLKVAFVKATPGADIDIKYRRNAQGVLEAEIKENGVSVEYREIALQPLLADPESAILEAARDLGDVNRYQLACGDEFEIPGTYSNEELLLRAANDLIQRYQPGGANYKASVNERGEITSSNDYREWMTGVYGYRGEIDSILGNASERAQARQSREFRAERKRAIRRGGRSKS